MAEVNPCFVLTTQTHGSEIMRSVARSLRLAAGIVDATDLTVSPGTGMQVSVSFGRAIIDGTESTLQGSYVVYNDAAVTKAIATADGSNPRIDLVVARVHDKDYSGATYNWAIEVVTGTPAPSPAVPATPANAVVLAQVLVPALSSSVTSGNITDKRAHVGIGSDATQIKGVAASAAAGSRIDVARLDHVHPDTGLMRLIDTQTPGAVASFDFVNPLPTGYRSLVIEWDNARGDTAANSVALLLRFNNDSAANYDYQSVVGSGAAASAVEALAQTFLQFGDMPALNATANYTGQGVAHINGYSVATGLKAVHSNYAYFVSNASGSGFSAQRTGKWRTVNTAITRITVLAFAGNFVAGSTFRLFAR